LENVTFRSYRDLFPDFDLNYRLTPAAGPPYSLPLSHWEACCDVCLDFDLGLG